MRWLLVAILSLIATASHANELLKIEKASFFGPSASALIPTEPTFTPLHTYFISPTGNDGNNGTSAGTPWLTPNHSGIVCGDILIAATGAYSSANFDSFSHGSSLWGTVGTCPSTSGGIDGAGQIYMVPLVCGTAFACTINATTQYAMNIDKSNWAVEGFTATATASGFGSCFVAAPFLGGSSIAYDAFINDIASGCGLAGFQASNNTTTFSISTDQFGVVGSIAFNGSQSAQECGSGISDNTPVNVNAQAGTHVYIAGNFSYGNINGMCGPNSTPNSGAYPPATGNFSAGASSITVAVVSGWGVNWPIAALDSSVGSYSTTAIPQPTFVSSVAGTTIGLSNNVASPGITSGKVIAVATSTDGEGLIFDSWALNPYTGQGVAENNLFWGNGGHAFEVFCNGTCGATLAVIVTQNTFYGNEQDYKISGPFGELYEQTSTGGMTFSATNNLVQASVVKPAGSITQAAWNGTTGVGGQGTGQPVNAGEFGRTGLTISGNWFKSAPSAVCPTAQGAVCDTNNSIADYNGVNYQSGNTLGTDPLFANVAALPATAPSCGSFATTVACMASVIAALTPSASGTAGKGYQAPGPCAADALYPIWTKGVVYLNIVGGVITEKAGLITKPCGL